MNFGALIISHSFKVNRTDSHQIPYEDLLDVIQAVYARRIFAVKFYIRCRTGIDL